MGQVSVCVETMNPSCGGGGGNVAGEAGGRGGGLQVANFLSGGTCSHINSHDQVRGHRTGSTHSGAEEYPREQHKQTKGGTRIDYITADAIHACTRNIMKNENTLQL